MALAVFSAVRDLSVVDRRHVLAVCERRLKGICSAEHSAAQAAAVDALRAFIDAHGGELPSKARFDAWRGTASAPPGLPSSFKVASAFGSWVAATAAVRGGKPVQLLQARRLSALGPAFTREEALKAIRDFDAAWSGAVTWTNYLAWARSTLKTNPGARLPLSPQTFRKHDGWFTLCREAGVDATHAKTRQPTRHYSVEELRDAAAAAQQDAGGGPLRRFEYDAWRKRKLDDSGSDVAPAPMAFVRRFGAWPEAMRELGLIDDQQFALAARSRPRVIADDEALDALITAAAEVHGPLASFSYTRWRCAFVPRPGEPMPPSAAWFRGRFGSWEAAIAAAEARGREQKGQS